MSGLYYFVQVNRRRVFGRAWEGEAPAEPTRREPRPPILRPIYFSFVSVASTALPIAPRRRPPTVLLTWLYLRMLLYEFRLSLILLVVALLCGVVVIAASTASI